MNKNIGLLLVILLFVGVFLVTAQVSAATATQGKIIDLTDIESETGFYPYGENYNLGAAVAVGDVTGDGLDNIVTSSGEGAKTHIRVFDISGNAQSWNIFPFVDAYRGGGSVAIGDTDGDGTNEIIVSPAGSNSGPLVRVYEYGKDLPEQSFYVFNEGFRGGINVAAGDTNKDGKAEIIAATASQRGNVAVYSGTGTFMGLSYFPFGPSFTEGVSIAAGDVTGNGKADIIIGSQGQTTSRVKVYKADASQQILGDFLAYDEKQLGGVNVAVADADGNGSQDIVTGVASNGKPHVRAFTVNGTPVNYLNFFPLEDTETAGINLGASDTWLVVVPAKEEKPMNICDSKPCVALTFDDGGSRAGSFVSILGTLAKHDVKASFFLIGRWMDGNRSMVKRVADEGHVLGNHTWNHSIATRIPGSQLASELTKADNLVDLITGSPTKPNFRYPGGAHNASTDAIVTGEGYEYWQWTADPRDAMGNNNPASIKQIALTGLHDGSVLLFHTGNSATAQALDGIITSIQAQGYELVTVDQLTWRAADQW
ncbi:polysaccharide deacetylase family protein [Patescibacteria group bacterium]